MGEKDKNWGTTTRHKTLRVYIDSLPWTFWVQYVEMSVSPSPSVLPCLSVHSTQHTVSNSACCFNSESTLFPQGSVCEAMVKCYCYLFSCTSVVKYQHLHWCEHMHWPIILFDSYDINKICTHFLWFPASPAFLNTATQTFLSKNPLLFCQYFYSVLFLWIHQGLLGLLPEWQISWVEL